MPSSGCRHHWTWRLAEPGDVIRVWFEEIDELLNSLPGRPTNHGTDDSRSDDSPRDIDDEHDREPDSVHDRGPLPTSGTAPQDRGNSGRYDTWAIGILLDALAVGTLWLTPVVLLVVCCFAFWAQLCILLCKHLCTRPPGQLMISVVVWHTSISSGTAIQVCHQAATVPCAQQVRPMSSEVWQLTAHRPLPTPCRAFREPPVHFLGPDAYPDLVIPQIGPTLLEESVQRPDCEAFFLASTLIETLLEHFDACEGLPTAEASSHETFWIDAPGNLPTTISLEALLPSPEHHGSVTSSLTEWFSLDCGQCETPLREDMWLDLNRFVPPLQLREFPSGLHKPERFSDWIDRTFHGLTSFPLDCVGICITSDGSFSPSDGSAGWGVVVSCLTSGHPVIPGQHFGQVGGITSDIWHFGGELAGPVNAFASEL